MRTPQQQGTMLVRESYTANNNKITPLGYVNCLCKQGFLINIQTCRAWNGVQPVILTK